MENKKYIQSDAFAQWVAKLTEQYDKVIAPVRIKDRYFFKTISAGEKWDATFINSWLSPKSYVFPRCECLMKYEKKGDETILENVIPKEEKIVIIGLRPCDVAAFAYMDLFFGAAPSDVHYQKRRENITIISVGCTAADAACFCTSVGITPDAASDADIFLMPSDDRFIVQSNTAKGDGCIEISQNLFSEINAEMKIAAADVPLRFELKTAEEYQQMYDSAEWSAISAACLSCGACAYACPTCSCFDVQDEGTQQKGQRVRTWDSCGFALFTFHASGHNPRTQTTDRRRQRLLHKFSYSRNVNGKPSCVGCGRCIRVCPAHLNITEQIKFLSSK